MKLKEALELGDACDLTTVWESIININMKAMSIFEYGKEQEEMDELIADFKRSGYSKGDLIKDIL